MRAAPRPEREIHRRLAARALERYWPGRSDILPAAPELGPSPAPEASAPPRMTVVPLPEWASDLAVAGGLLVPAHTAPNAAAADWEKTDWLEACFWYLHGAGEREHENRNGPVHSFAYRLRGWDGRIWDRAWANRIALFLRRLAARRLGRSEQEIFGPLPSARLALTHDVDAVRKTVPIRLKQTAFKLFGAASELRRGRLPESWRKLKAAAAFLVGKDNYWCFDRIRRLEADQGLTGWWMFYGGRGGWARHPREVLFDPFYRVDERRISEELRDLVRSGSKVGLHQSFGAWRDSALMVRERLALEAALGERVTLCRQHWLRFSWAETWAAQEAAGFDLDCTLGFNDRPGFRNGAALRYHPWKPDLSGEMRIESLPMVLMDSHLYDYAGLKPEEIGPAVDAWIDEVRLVRGEASIIWHQRVFSRDYGWRPGYERVLARAAEMAGEALDRENEGGGAAHV